MSQMSSTVDKKGATSSLSADAAEFVPVNSVSLQANVSPILKPLPPGVPPPNWKGEKPAEVTEVPRYLTSCYPFVSPEEVVRSNVPRFPSPFPYAGGMASAVPMSIPRPIRFPPWQAMRAGFVGDGLLPTPAQLGMPVPPMLGQSLLLAPQPEPSASWIMTTTPPMFVQQPPPPHQHLPFSSKPQPVLAAATQCTALSQQSSPRTKVSTGCQSETGDMRPSSPVLISRSSQTDLPSAISKFSLKERPHLFYIKQNGNNQSKSEMSKTDTGGWKERTEDQDSDSGYNSPMHRQNLVSSGTQVASPGTIGYSVNITNFTATVFSKSSRLHAQSATHHSIKEGELDERVSEEGTDGGNSSGHNETHSQSKSSSHNVKSAALEGKKKRRKKKDIARSPRMLGSNSKLLSRSSSSISSAGTKPDEDDEKIDLHSWTDFPPMSSRGAPPPGLLAKPLMKSPLSPEERIPLTIERSAHEPPWSIKFTSEDETRSTRSRSSSGDQDKSLGASLISPPESAWGKIGRAFRNSQVPGLGEELSFLMAKSDAVSILTSRSVNGSSNPSRSGSRHNSGGGGSSGCASPNPAKSDQVIKHESSSAVRIKSGERGQYGKTVTPKTGCGNIGQSQKMNVSQDGNEEKLKAKNAWAVANTKVPSSSAVSSLSLTSVAPATINAATSANINSVKNVTNAQWGPNQPARVGYGGGSGIIAQGGALWENVSRQARNASDANSSTKRHSGPLANSVAVTDGSSAPSSLVPQSTSGLSQPLNTVPSPGLPLPGIPSSSSSSILLVSSSSLMMPSATTFMGPATVTAEHGPKPGLSGAAAVPAPPLNYNIPPPSQPPPILQPGSSVPPPYQTFRSYANITQGAINTSSGFHPMGASHSVHSGISPPFLGGGDIPFAPPPHFAAPPISFPAYYAGSMTQQPPALNVHPPISHNPSFATASPGVRLRTPVPATTHLPSSSPGAYSKIAKQYTPPKTSTVRPPLVGQETYPVSKSIDINSNSLINPSAQTPFNMEQIKPVESDMQKLTLSPQNAEEEKKKHRRRRRRRTRSNKRGKEDGAEESDGSQVLECAISSSNVSESTLHFEDADEFPDLLPSSSRGVGQDMGVEKSNLPGTLITYSDIIKSTWSKAGSQSRTQSLTGSCVSGDNDDDDDIASCHTGATNESKRARKRRKRREQANKAAEAELAEIILEQQWLKEVGLKKSASHRSGESTSVAKVTPGIITDSNVVGEAKRQGAGKGGGKKSQQPIALDIAAMIDALQKKPSPPSAPSSLSHNKQCAGATPTKATKKDRERGPTSGGATSQPGNMLDSSAPVQKRGKERESGKAKKPSPLKKVILKEREQRKRLRLLDEDPDSATGLEGVGSSPGVGIVGESELSQDALSSKSEGTDGGDASGAAELSADLSPISQTSPISMSPASPGNSGVNSPITGSVGRDPVVMKIHSRRFREYCTQILDKEIDQCCTSLLQDLVKFQDRMYHKDPVKAKTKRRVVLGLREVTKHLKLKKIKCVVISPNLEKIQSKGGLDEALNNILNMCREQDVPFVFALGRRALGRACAKLVPVSVVGIFSYEGCESKYRNLISLTAAARTAYNEMVLAVEKEVAEYPTMASQSSSIGGVPGLFAAHMGHSRTPSGCSAISFTSSILSEPISENYPHAEPEVDSKGYEIVRDAAGNVVHPSGIGGKEKGVTNDIDDGNEADTEDFGESRRKRKGGRNVNSVRFGDIGSGLSDGDDVGKESGLTDSGKAESVTDDGDDRSSMGKLSRNVSESTLTNEDNFILKGDSFAVKHLSNLEDFEDQDDDENGDFDMGNGMEDGSNKEKRWAPFQHIDSIHSFSYNLGEEILSHHSPVSHDSQVRGQIKNITGDRHPDEPQADNNVYDDDDEEEDDDGIDENVDGDGEVEEEEEEEEEEEDEKQEKASLRHHRVIDKERIENWLESQTNIATKDRTPVVSYQANNLDENSSEGN